MSNVELIFTILGLVSALTGFLGYLFLPRFRGFIWNTLEDDTIKFDALRIESFNRQVIAHKESIKLMFAKELAELEAIKPLVEEHTDRLKFIDAVLIEQGKELKQMPIIASAMQASADSIKEIARSMKEIHKEVAEHGKRLERWEGFFEGQEHGERRKIKRRIIDKEE